MNSERHILKHILCSNNINYGRANVIVFTDVRAPGMNYVWVTVTSGASHYIEGQYYDISAQWDGRGILKQVKLVKDYTKSEQPDAKSKKPVDVFNLIFDTDT